MNGQPPERMSEYGLRWRPGARLLGGPEEFDPGPDGQYLEPIIREYAEKLDPPVWYTVPVNSGGSLTGSILPEDRGRVVTARVGFNRQQQTELFVHGRLKRGASRRSRYERIPEGRLTEYGRKVWGWEIHAEGTDFHVDVYVDDAGLYWTIAQDLKHASVGLQQHHQTYEQCLRAA